eukprot:CAMPEP_0180328152 /NCGR_PEP_ID=MMETSP0988-20121125/39988_1 /TAXON_ID=697907 /ORGANISM="non described non described, Strain CCMP2293" /LENGTH=148 /DNA_ID=CAMNT_0022314995 /DNA_START=456 /DNA_END=898 /DNA_ORIENTATION=+
MQLLPELPSAAQLHRRERPRHFPPRVEGLPGGEDSLQPVRLAAAAPRLGVNEDAEVFVAVVQDRAVRADGLLLDSPDDVERGAQKVDVDPPGRFASELSTRRHPALVGLVWAKRGTLLGLGLLWCDDATHVGWAMMREEGAARQATQT